MALTTAQQRLILNATLNLDPASQRKIENAFGDGLVKKLLEASTDGGEEFAAGAGAAFSKVQVAQAALNNAMKKSAASMEKAETLREKAEEHRKAQEKALADAVIAKALGDKAAVKTANDKAKEEGKAAEKLFAAQRRAEKLAAKQEEGNRDKIKTARAELAMQIRAAKNYEAMYDAANAVRDEQLKREEEIYKFAGERKAKGAVKSGAEDLTAALDNVRGVFESPTLENAVGTVAKGLSRGFQHLEATIKTSDSAIAKAIRERIGGNDESVSKIAGYATSILGLAVAGLKLAIKVYDTKYTIRKGFTDSVAGNMYRGTSAGEAQTTEIARGLGVSYTEAAQMVGEAWNENVGGALLGMATTAKALGLSIGEVASQTTKLNSNFKTTGNIFEETAGLAQETGLSLQSAYGILQGVTTGVQLMNTNLSRSFGYVKKLVQTFGEELGTQLAQSLGIVRGMSPQDALKELLLMKEEDRKEMFRQAAEDTSEATPQELAAKAMLMRGAAEGATLEDQAIALRHLGPRAELYMEGKRGGGLFGDYKPDTMGFAEAAGRASLGMTSADTEVRQLALKFGDLGDGITELHGGTLAAASAMKDAAKDARTFDESLQRVIDSIAVGGLNMDPADVADAIRDAVYKAVVGRDPKGAIEELVRLGDKAQDFIYRGNGTTGTLTPINSQDQFFGAKPGGPIDTAMKMAGVVKGIGGLGGAGTTIRTPAGAGAARGVGGGAAAPSHVTVNINGGDLGKVYEVVRNVLRQSGLRPPAGAYAG